MAMDENVGKGCTCIHSFEKHYVDNALGDEIEGVKKQITEIESVVAEEKKKEQPGRLLASLEGSIPLMKSILRDYETVRKRFADMPSCD